MREIKFRAWNIPNELMYKNVQDGLLAENEKGQLVLGVSLGTISKDAGSVLMQFTGLHDKNGKEIYEGDIIDFKFWNKEGVGSVAFQDGAFGISTYSKTIELYLFNPFCSYDEPEKDCYPFIEVIGNIYENPELLNQ